ncbi:MAG: serine O-acetyltransferase [Planctomycetaceae bacterium]|nr:serine O-acetyltransferase [Planctomycetaceae bacterium]
MSSRRGGTRDAVRCCPVVSAIVSEMAVDQETSIWLAVHQEASAEIAREPILAGFLHTTVLKHDSLESSLSFHLAGKLASESLPSILLRELIDETMAADPRIGRAIRADLQAVHDRDPASHGYLTPFLYFKGFHALQAHRIAHWLWNQERRVLAVHLQNRISEVFGADIHPAACMGSGILIDHGTGVVIGETAVVEDNVSMLHEVTLGGTGKQTGDRHPKVREGVLIGAGAKVLGNVEIGAGAKIGAGSVVLDAVPPHRTVAGVPARIVGMPHTTAPALEMDQSIPHVYTDGSGI